MWNCFSFVSAALVCILIFKEVNPAFGKQPAGKKPVPILPNPEVYNVGKFNGTILVNLKDKKEVLPVEIGKKVGKIVFRVGNDRRIHFNLGKAGGKTAVLTMKKNQGDLILKGGNQTVKVTSHDISSRGPFHVGVTFI